MIDCHFVKQSNQVGELRSCCCGTQNDLNKSINQKDLKQTLINMDELKILTQFNMHIKIIHNIFIQYLLILKDFQMFQDFQKVRKDFFFLCVYSKEYIFMEQKNPFILPSVPLYFQHCAFLSALCNFHSFQLKKQK